MSGGRDRPTLAPQTRAALLMVAAAAIWGLTFTAGKVASLEASPLSATLWRFVLAGLALAPLAVKASWGKPRLGLAPMDLPLLLLSGLTGLVMYNYFFIKALALIQAGRGSVIVCGSPALIYLGSVIFFGERLSAVRLAGLALSVLGTAWAVSFGRPWALFSTGLGRGDLVMLLCPLSWTAYSLLAKLVLRRQGPLAANAWSVLAAVALLLPLVPLSGGSLSEFSGYGSLTWACLAFLGLGGTALGFTIFYRGILVLGPHRAAAYINLVPVFGILFSWLLLGETPGLALFVGLAMIVMGIRLVQKY